MSRLILTHSFLRVLHQPLFSPYPSSSQFTHFFLEILTADLLLDSHVQLQYWRSSYSTRRYSTASHFILLPILTFIHAAFTGTNVPIPSDRTPIGYHIHVSTSSGRWNTTIKAAGTAEDYSISWNEFFNIHGTPLTFFQWLIPKVFRTSEPIHLEIRALYESGLEPVSAFETTFEQLLGCDRQSSKSSFLALSYVVPDFGSKVTLPAINDQSTSLSLNINTTPHASSSSPEVRGLFTEPRHRAYS